MIAGSGVAALEAALALRELAGDRVKLTLLAPGSSFAYQPMAVLEPFIHRVPRRLALARISADLNAALVRDTVASVDCEGRAVRTGEGRRLAYDALVIAVGATVADALPGALRVDVAHMHRSLQGLIAAIDEGTLHRVAIAVPRPSWPLPAYELALLLSEHASEQQLDLAVALITAEERPLAAFGEAVSAELGRLLARAGVETIAGARPQLDAGGLRVQSGARPRRFDQVLAFPRLVGPAIPGLPADADGFLPTSSDGAVIGAVGVYAAGDASDFPLKYGGVAAGQADAIAAAIAAAAGAPVAPAPFDGVVHGFLVAGRNQRRHYFTVRIGDGVAHDVRVADAREWAPGTKITARYLGPYLDGLWTQAPHSLAGPWNYSDPLLPSVRRPAE